MTGLNLIIGTGCKDYPYTFPYFRLLPKPSSKPLTFPEKVEPEEPNNGPKIVTNITSAINYFHPQEKNPQILKASCLPKNGRDQ